MLNRVSTLSVLGSISAIYSVPPRAGSQVAALLQVGTAVLTVWMIDSDSRSTTCIWLLPSDTHMWCPLASAMLFGPWPLVVAVPPPVVATPTKPVTRPAYE